MSLPREKRWISEELEVGNVFFDSSQQFWRISAWVDMALAVGSTRVGFAPHCPLDLHDVVGKRLVGSMYCDLLHARSILRYPPPVPI